MFSIFYINYNFYRHHIHVNNSIWFITASKTYCGYGTTAASNSCLLNQTNNNIMTHLPVSILMLFCIKVDYEKGPLKSTLFADTKYQAGTVNAGDTALLPMASAN